MRQLLCAAIALAAVSAARAQPQTYDLRYDLAPGRTFGVASNSELSIMISDTSAL